jgi:glycosyltransferase involved in cell wall biosynthesis
MRVHVVGLPHTQTTREYDWCAYTAKIRRLGGMLHARGHEMLLYAGQDNEALCTEHVPITRPERWFGDAGWDHKTVFNQWDSEAPCWIEMGLRAIIEIRERIEPGDAVGIIAGLCQKPIADHFAALGHPIVEWGIGYDGILDISHRAFESRAWQHYVYGKRGESDGRYFDAVIPNAFDADDFKFNAQPADYLLFLGRHTRRKGLAVVEELAKRYPVITAGQQEMAVPGTEHVGMVLGDEKAELLANARAVIVPTTYIEPFGGVAVEAMLSGAPAITTDWGAFPETVNHGVSGFRCHTLGEFIDAVEQAPALDREQVRAWAQQFTTEPVSHLYDRWLRRIALLPEPGWYST